MSATVRVPLRLPHADCAPPLSKEGESPNNKVLLVLCLCNLIIPPASKDAVSPSNSFQFSFSSVCVCVCGGGGVQ